MGLAIGFLKLVRTVQYRDQDTGEINARENRSEGVLLVVCERDHEKINTI
jgi:hypothetical protein